MFDPSAPHIIILLVVVLLLFGSRRLPGAAKSLGESMHIFKKSVQGMGEEDEAKDVKPQATLQQTVLPQAAPALGNTATTHEQQLADLQRQISDLQRQNAGGSTFSEAGAPLSDAQQGQQTF
jgi:sec-independent protein translocase protein TatA